MTPDRVGLLGTWLTRSVGGDATPDGVESKITLSITADGEPQMHGRGGVNTFGGGFELVGDEIVFGPTFTTLMAGFGAAAEHEQALYAALSGRKPFRVDSDMLVIGEGHDQVVFDRVETFDITGTVTYRQRIALPPGAVVKVQLDDVSRADAPLTTIAQQVIVVDGQVPVMFRLTVERRALDERHTYSLAAQIVFGGEPRWRSGTHIPVSPDAPPDGVEIVVRPVRPAPSD